MSRRVRFAARAADIVKFEADAIGLKYQGHLSGATMQVARAMGVSKQSLDLELWAEGESFGMAGNGKIGARFVVFLRVPPPAAFKYAHVRQFNADMLRLMRMFVKDARHIALPTHGVGFDDDLEDSLTAIIRGCGDAIRHGDIPDQLEQITIVDRRFDDAAAIKRVFSDLVPEGWLEAPGDSPPAPPPLQAPATADFPKPSLYDIFISYKSEDERLAGQVYDVLTRNGLRVFFSRKSLPALGSTAYHDQIDKALEHARHMVVVTSSLERVEAKWVKYEWKGFIREQLAGRKTGNLITVIGGQMTIAELPFALRGFEVLRCDEEGLERLIEFTRQDVDRRGADVAAPAPPPAPTPRTTDVTAVTVGPDLMVAANNVLWNTSWKDALEHLLLSRDVDASRGWRMPTLDELRAIRKQSVLPEDSCYWSSEEAGKAEARYMHFDDGHVGQGPKSFAHGVSAVFVRTAR